MMQQFYDDYRPRRFGFLRTIVVAIISAVVGGLVALTFFHISVPKVHCPSRRQDRIIVIFSSPPIRQWSFNPVITR